MILKEEDLHQKQGGEALGPWEMVVTLALCTQGSSELGCTGFHQQ